MLRYNILDSFGPQLLTEANLSVFYIQQDADEPAYLYANRLTRASHEYAKYLYQKMQPLKPHTLVQDLTGILTRDLFLRSLQKNIRDDLVRQNMLHLPLKDLMLHARNIERTKATKATSIQSKPQVQEVEATAPDQAEDPELLAEIDQVRRNFYNKKNKGKPNQGHQKKPFNKGKPKSPCWICGEDGHWSAQCKVKKSIQQDLRKHMQQTKSSQQQYRGN